MTTSNQNLITEQRIPFNKLRLSPNNVRKPAPKGDKQRFKLSIESLAESILAVGVVQNLVVTTADDGMFDVWAGGRRYTAVGLLVKQARVPDTYEVLCKVVPESMARAMSLTENLQRENLHPVDEFLAWQALVQEGKSIEDVGAIFGVEPGVVRRRLKLASVSPRLLKACREDQASIEQLMAVAITDDHKLQERTFFNVQQEWQRNPRELKARLTEGDVTLAKDGAARLVGIEAYRAAGGVTREDLFAEDGEGVYLCDKDLLDRLALEKLAPQIEAVRAEGWKWVDGVVRGVNSGSFYQWGRVQARGRKATEDEAKHIAKLDKAAQAAQKKADNYSGDDDDHRDELYDAAEEANTALASFKATLRQYSKKQMEVAGVVVWVASDGEVTIEAGLVRDEDKKAAKALEGPAKKKGAAVAEGEAEADQVKPTLSEALCRRLTAHRTLALQAELAQQPKVALVAVVHKFALKALGDDFWHEDLPAHVNCSPQGVFEGLDPELPNSAAAKAITAAKAEWQAKLPRNGDEEVESDKLWVYLLALDIEQLLSLLAVCTALSVNAVQGREGPEHDRAAPLALALDLDMAQWYAADMGYFGAVSKDTILKSVREFAPDQVEGLDKLKKGELAAKAASLAVGTRWLPQVLRRPS